MRTRGPSGWLPVVALAAAAGCSATVPPPPVPSPLLSTSAPSRLGSPVEGAVPGRAPRTSVAADGACLGLLPPTGSAPGVGGVVVVDRAPRAVVLEWLPGLDQRPCRTVLTRGGPAVARRLSAAIDAAPAVRPGAYNCPADDGSAVRLFFTFGSGPAETVTVGLAGCRWMTGAARSPRSLTDRVSADLGPPPPEVPALEDDAVAPLGSRGAW